MYCILDMRVVNTDTTDYLHKYPEKSFLTAEWDKNNKYLETCLQKHCHLSPFMVLAEIFIGSEVESTMKILNIRIPELSDIVCLVKYYLRHTWVSIG